MSFSVELRHLVHRRPWLAVARAASAGAAASTLLLGAATARADCALSPPRVAWSSPAAGSTDVSTNADLLLVTESIDLARAEITLVGGAIELTLEPGSALPGHFELGELEPDHRYTIIVDPIDSEAIEITFDTGVRRAESTSAALSLQSVSRAPFTSALESGLCEEALRRDTCFDTGLPVLETFELADDPATVGPTSLWVMEATAPAYGVTWLRTLPAACGSPRQLSFGASGSEYRIYSIGEGGSIRSSNVLSPSLEGDEPDGASGTEPARDASCATPAARAESSAVTSLGVAALALTAALRRRRTRTEREHLASRR